MLPENPYEATDAIYRLEHAIKDAYDIVESLARDLEHAKRAIQLRERLRELIALEWKITLDPANIERGK